MMKMFEKLKVGTRYKYPTDEEMKHAEKVYDRYVACLKKRYGGNYGSDRAHTAMTLTEFLLTDVDYSRLDAFEWDRGVLVRLSDGRIGMTMGWGQRGYMNTTWGVNVTLATGVSTIDPAELAVADIPPEVLEYVKSTLQGKVHSKVDEAFRQEAE